MISSLLRLKEDAPDSRTCIQEIEHQIDAIRIVHEKLYQSETVNAINIREYLQDLVSTIIRSFAGFPIEFENLITDTIIQTRKVIPLGLIVNELTTNFLKYNIIPDEKQKLSIALTENREMKTRTLTISNTGTPLPVNADLQNPETFGFRLINELVKQIGGEIYLKRSPIPEFRICFPM